MFKALVILAVAVSLLNLGACAGKKEVTTTHVSTTHAK